VAVATADYRQSVLSALQEAADQLEAAHNLAEQAASQAQALAAARRAAHIARAQYRAGTVNALQLLSAENSAHSAAIQALAIDSRRLQALLQLFKLTAGGWDVPAPVAQEH
jgi:outer membrane protein TolC